jgi:hypothetical protein
VPYREDRSYVTFSIKIKKGGKREREREREREQGRG